MHPEEHTTVEACLDTDHAAWVSRRFPGPQSSQHKKAQEREVPFGVLLFSFTYSPLPSFRGKDLPAVPGLAHLTKHPVRLSLTHISRSSLHSPGRAPGGVQRLRIHRLHLIHGKIRLPQPRFLLPGNSLRFAQKLTGILQLQ